MNLVDFYRRFPNEESCVSYLKTKREEQGIVCPKCGCTHHYWKSYRNQWECKECGHRTGIKSGTVMHSSNLPLLTWFMAIHLVTSTKKFNEFSRELENMNVSEVVEHNLSDQDTMFEMANLPPRRTGLKYQIWYSAKVEKHKPRIKVDLGDGNSISVQIEDHKVIGATDKISSKDLNDIFTWIDMNKEILMAYWNNAHTGVIDNGDVIEKVKKIQ